MREEVAVYPNRSHHIMGRLSLVKQHGVLFLAWLPYSRGSLGQDGSFQARDLCFWLPQPVTLQLFPHKRRRLHYYVASAAALFATPVCTFSVLDAV